MVVTSFNTPLRKAYFETLSGIVYSGATVPVYNEMAPDNTPDLYITFSGITNSDASLKAGVFTDCTVIISVYSRAEKYNSAGAVDIVTNEVLQRITGGFTVDGFDVIYSKITNDNTQNFRILNQLVAIDRLITISHKIYQQ